MNQPQASATSPNINPGSVLIEHIRSFLHLTTQAPLEYVCKSALYLLTHVPATRAAVFEYIGTFYKVATFLHIRYNQSLKSTQKNSEQQTAALLSNITHINQVLDLIESQLSEILHLNEDTVNDLWSIELAKWLIDLMGDIILNKGATFGESGLSEEESKLFKSLSLIDALEFWSNKCKPTMGILKLIQKCHTSASEECQEQIIDLILTRSSQYTECFDWLLCDLAALSPQSMFEKCLKIGHKEFLLDTNKKLLRTGFTNFYALNFSRFVKIELAKFIEEIVADDQSDHFTKKKLALIYLFKLITNTPTLLNLLLNEILTSSSGSGEKFINFLKYCFVNCEDKEGLLVTNLIECIKQINNSIATVDLISSVIEVIYPKSLSPDEELQNKIISTIMKFLGELEMNVYNDDSCNYEEGGQHVSSIPFLKCLNTINGSSFVHLLDQVFTALKTTDAKDEHSKKKHEILYRFLVLLAINGTLYVSNSIMNQLMRLPLSLDLNQKEIDYFDWPLIVKFRQETNPFHYLTLRETMCSLCKTFANQTNKKDFDNFLLNIFLIYDWDKKHKHCTSENISHILMNNECMISLLSLLTIRKNVESQASYLIIELYSNLLKSNEENLPILKLTLSDMIIFATKLVEHFFFLFEQINEENIGNLSKELSKLNELIKYSLMHLSYLNEEMSPFRNIILRTLINKLFEVSQIKSLSEKISDESKSQIICDDEFPELKVNLFDANLNLTSNDIATHKGKFKNFKNTLAEFPAQRKIDKKFNDNKYKIMMSFAFTELLELLCTLEISEDFIKLKVKRQMFDAKTEIDSTILGSPKKQLLTEQMTLVADMLVEYVMLDQHYIDSQWPSPPANESDDNIEAEVETLKLYIERDVAVQNIVENPNNNKVIWMMLDFLTMNETSFLRSTVLIRSLLASIIIKWESFHEQPTRNMPKLIELTVRLLDVLNKVDNFIPKPLCFIVDIIPFINAYEAHVSLLLIWKYLKNKLNPKQSQTKPATSIETKQLRYIFQRNILKLDFLYAKFFKL